MCVNLQEQLTNAKTRYDELIYSEVQRALANFAEGIGDVLYLPDSKYCVRITIGKEWNEDYKYTMSIFKCDHTALIVRTYEYSEMVNNLMHSKQISKKSFNLDFMIAVDKALQGMGLEYIDMNLEEGIVYSDFVVSLSETSK